MKSESEYSVMYPIALYGLGTETERFLFERGKEMNIVALLDGFRNSGEMYGYPIIPLSECVSRGVQKIIVVARPGSCKLIAKRIGAFCRENSIELFDVRGRDLLETPSVSFCFQKDQGTSRRDLQDKIDAADVVSFDLFDTLVTRRVFSYTDVFEILDVRHKEKGTLIPNFAKQRLFFEKELSKDGAPRLVEIYEYVLKTAGIDTASAEEFARLECELDQSTLVPRMDVCAFFKKAVSDGKQVVVTTDSYYSFEQISEILESFGLVGYDRVLVSCEYGTSKTQDLFSGLNDVYPDKRVLHIGDDEAADIEGASESGLDTCRIYSGTDLLDMLGGLGLDEKAFSLSDRVKLGMFVSDIFNSPFWFEEEEQRLSVRNSFQIGYLFCAPLITEFLLWLKKRTEEQEIGQLIFGARDGYLPKRLFDDLSPEAEHFYMFTSRTSAIRAGVESKDDIAYVDSMKFFGTPEEVLEARFGIMTEDVTRIDRTSEILKRAESQRANYRKYVEEIGKTNREGGLVGFFDFVAKGTTQMYLERVLAQPMKGLYFLQLEPEFMADKGLDIEAFFSEEERDTSSIFDNYYILETILTSPEPQVLEFDDAGGPVFAEETRSEEDIRCVMSAQEGVRAFFEEYIRLVPEGEKTENKALDEAMLALINHVQILDEAFMALKVEDPFFGRMTEISDVIG